MFHQQGEGKKLFVIDVNKIQIQAHLSTFSHKYEPCGSILATCVSWFSKWPKCNSAFLSKVYWIGHATLQRSAGGVGGRLTCARCLRDSMQRADLPHLEGGPHLMTAVRAHLERARRQ